MSKTDAPSPSLPAAVEPGRSKCFWLAGGLLAALMTMTMSRDIAQPFIGLHSWAKASGAWAARTHVKYGWGYTKGISTWAVGQPPPKDPKRYLDQPQLTANLLALEYLVLGTDAEWVYRGTVLVLTVAGLLLFLMVVRQLMDERAAILAGLFYVVFPITGYFGTAGWLGVLIWPAMWCYLVLIGSLPGGPPPGRRHMWGLGLSLFFMLQFAWTGAFYAAAIGMHYLARCLWRRQRPVLPLLAVIVLAPAGSLLVTFLIMAGGYGWDIGKIVDLYRWRAAKGEMAEFKWDDWFEVLARYSQTNYTLPPLLLMIGYGLVAPVRGLANLAGRKDRESRGAAGAPQSAGAAAAQAPAPVGFPQWWLLVAPGVLQLMFLRGILWKHQTSLLPFTPVVAVAAALAIVAAGRALARTQRRLGQALTVAAVACVVAFCAAGTDDYYNIRWQSPVKIAMLKWLNKEIPPAQALLALWGPEEYMTDQNASKGAFYRPEIAFYLDRNIDHPATPQDLLLAAAEAAGTDLRQAVASRELSEALSASLADPKAAAQAAGLLIAQIQAKASQGHFPIFVMPTSIAVEPGKVVSLMPVARALQRKYPLIHTFPAYYPEPTPDHLLRMNSPEFYVFSLGGAAAAPPPPPATAPGN